MQQQQQQQHNEVAPLLRNVSSNITATTTALDRNQHDATIGNQSKSSTGSGYGTNAEIDVTKVMTESNISSNQTTTTTTEATTTTPIPGQGTDGIITKQQNIPIIELMAITAIISGSLSMYWGITGLVVGTTTSTIISMIVTAIITQPIIIVHVIMSTCVVVLAPVVTVQKVQLRTLGTLREQQNELRTQINTLNQTNDELTKSVTSISDETTKVEQVNQELQTIATTAGTTTDRLVQLYKEQNEIQKEIYKNLQAKILEQIITILLQTDSNHNNIVSDNEVTILMERFKQLSGIVFNERTFRSILNQSEPKGSITVTDICTIVRNIQQQYTNNDTTTTNISPTTSTTNINKTSNDESVEVNPFDEPIFKFQQQDLKLMQN
jgi:regulator of replication initiation timing